MTSKHLTQRLIIQKAVDRIADIVCANKTLSFILRNGVFQDSESVLIRHAMALHSQKLKPLQLYEILISLNSELPNDPDIEHCVVESYKRLVEHLLGRKQEKTMYLDLVEKMRIGIDEGNFLTPNEIDSEVKRIRQANHLKVVHEYQARKKAEKSDAKA